MAGPTIETAIWLALRARVEALVLSPALPVAWPNEAFTKPTNAGYLRVTWMPNRAHRLFIGSGEPHLRPSLLQIDVFGKKNENAAVALDIAGKVAAHFPADLNMTAYGVTARITAAPSIAHPLPEDTHFMVPVTVPVEVFA